jgi:hypothetical protein
MLKSCGRHVIVANISGATDLVLEEAIWGLDVVEELIDDDGNKDDDGAEDATAERSW